MRISDWSSDVCSSDLPELYQRVFNPEVSLALSGIAAWEVMVFVWIAGIELDLHEAWAKRRDSATTARLAMGAPLLFGALAAGLMLLHAQSWMGSAANPWQFVAGVGMACEVTALPILHLFMAQRNVLLQHERTLLLSTDARCAGTEGV